MNGSKVTAKLLFALWLCSVSLIALLGAFTIGAAMFRHIQAGGDKIPEPLEIVVTTLAEAPSLVKQAFTEVSDVVTGRPSALLIPKDQVVKPEWKHQFPAPDDDGYLLLSGVSPVEKRSIVQLIRIADGNVLAKWVPDWDYIHSQIKHHRFAPKGNSKAYRAFHPLLLADGSLIFNTGGSLVRLPLCSSKPSWVLDYPYHHSIEFSASRNSVWVPSVTEEFFVDNKILKNKLRDDSLAEVSLDGKVLQNLSFSRILANNQLMAQMIGNTGAILNNDPIHINQITVATTKSSYWNEGDLLVSSRHLSSIYIYRPSTDKLIWHQQGPWLNQHSVHFINNHQIIVLSNHVYGAKLKEQFIFKDKTNHINQITVATTKSSYWNEGDLLVSSRHLSSIYIYRPSTDKLIWHQQGPWLNQHSVHFINNHQIIVLSNHVYGAKLKEQFIFKDKTNRVYLHNFNTSKTNELFYEILHKLNPATIYEGRVQLLTNNSIFIEETNNSRIFKIDSDGNLQWSYINFFDKKYLGAVSWSRYLSRDEIKALVTSKSLSCDMQPY